MKVTIAIALLLSFAFVDVSNGGRLLLSDEEKRRLSKGIKSVKAYESDDGRILAEKHSKATKLYKPDRRLANDCGVCMSGCNHDSDPEQCRQDCKDNECSPNGSPGGKGGKSGGSS